MKNLSNSTFLIVDDDKDIREVLSSILIEEGSKTLLASGGHEALKILNSNKVDLVITDMRMPNGSGDELIRAIRKNKTFNSLPIIAVTGYSDIHKAELLKLGVVSVISKPFSIAHILQSVETCLQD